MSLSTSLIQLFPTLIPTSCYHCLKSHQVSTLTMTVGVVTRHHFSKRGPESHLLSGVYISIYYRNNGETCEQDACNAIKGHWELGHIPFCFEEPNALDLRHMGSNLSSYTNLYFWQADEFVCILGCCLETREMFILLAVLHVNSVLQSINRKNALKYSHNILWLTKSAHVFSAPQPSPSVEENWKL